MMLNMVPGMMFTSRRDAQRTRRMLRSKASRLAAPLEGQVVEVESGPDQRLAQLLGELLPLVPGHGGREPVGVGVVVRVAEQQLQVFGSDQAHDEPASGSWTGASSGAGT